MIVYLFKEKQRQMEQMNGGHITDCHQVAPFQGTVTSPHHLQEVIFQ